MDRRQGWNRHLPVRAVGSALMASIRDIADRTPETRNRAIDLFRAAALIIVVLGHWLASAVFVDDTGEHRFSEPEPAIITVREMGILSWLRGSRPSN